MPGSRKGKGDLIRMLRRDHGISKRKAERAVNLIFDSMKEALRHGEPVELPIGQAWIDSAPLHRQKVRFQKFRNIQGGQKFFKFVRYPKREIRFRPYPQLIEPPPKPKRVPKPGRKPRKRRTPKPPPTPLEKIHKLHRQLVGVDPEPEHVETMLGLCGNKESLLLQHLRGFAEEARRFPSSRHLVSAIGRRQRIIRDLG